MFFLHAEDFFSYTEKKCFPSQKTHARSLVYRIYQQSIIPRYPQQNASHTGILIIHVIIWLIYISIIHKFQSVNILSGE